MSPRLYIQKQVAALDSRKCCDTGEYILRSSTKQREGVGETVVASGPLLEGDEPGAVGGSDTRPTVLHLKSFVLGTVNSRMVGATGCDRRVQKGFLMTTHRLVGDGELAQVVSNHLRLDLNLEEKSDDIQ